ncbi:Hypothetical predicted protein [Xyrichtys novacula]|uniref:Uncharacterized protein n=1 Tax=Xyrichtys novacula TaxID=13765 RepID=A0AAV1GXR5_XYRNO|nr:Hypothetical predicted protein [Xyrichtys novacula]
MFTSDCEEESSADANYNHSWISQSLQLTSSSGRTLAPTADRLMLIKLLLPVFISQSSSSVTQSSSLLLLLFLLISSPQRQTITSRPSHVNVQSSAEVSEDEEVTVKGWRGAEEMFLTQLARHVSPDTAGR